MDLKDRLNEFSGDITVLNTNVESLRSAGQDLDADAIIHLASQHALLMDQVSQQVDQCEQAVSLRQQFLQYKSELEEVIQACETRVEVIKQPGVTNDDKIKGYKEVLAKFNAADPILVVLSEKGYQVSVESSPSDCEVVSSQLEVLKHEVEHLKASIETEYSQCEQIRKERENFATMTAKSIDWLERRCEMMATKGSLDVDAEKVEALQRKHHNLEDEVMSSLSETYSRTKLQEMSLKEAQELVPQSLIDHLCKLSDLKERIQVVAEEKDQYLGNAKANRAELEQSLKQVTAWLRGADDLLNSGQDGLDYDTLQTSLQEHKEYFSEASLCQDEVEHINELADLILPTVDENDRATLQQSLRNVNHKVNEAIRSAQNKQDTMETKLAEWNEYQDLVQGVTRFLTECEEKWACLDGAIIHTQSDTLQQIADVKEFKETLDSRRDAIDRLNDIGRGLDRCCNDSGRKVLGQQIHSVNQRWHDLVNHAQNKLDTTKELDERYRLFDETLASVHKTLREADQTSDTKDILTLPSQQLTERLALTKDSSRKIQACLDQIHEMKKEADMLIPDIPGAEAKVELQRCMIEVMEEQGRLSEKTQDYEQSLQDEVDARDKFKTDMSQATAVLHQIDKQLTNPSVAQKSLPLNEKLAKNKEIHADIDQRIQTIDSRAASLKDKYTSEGASLPADIGTQLQDLVSLRDTLRDKLKKDNELMEQKRLAKEEFDKLSRELNETVVNCTGALVSKVDLSPESIQKHKDLGLELEVCLEKLKLLKPMSDNLVENSRDKSERKRIRRTVNELDEKLRNLDARYKKQTESFNKASELSHTLSVALAPIVEKTGVLNEEIHTPIDNADLTLIFPNIERCSASLTDIEKQLKNLKTMKRQVSELDRLCGASSERVTINETNKTLQDLVKQAKDRLQMLEKASGVLEECECEFRSACDLIGETNTMMSSNMSDTSLGDQAPLLQGLLSRLEIKRDEVDEIARNHPEALHVVPKTAMSVCPDQLPTELRNKIAAVSRHLQQTQQALAEYEQQDEQIRKLTEAIGLAEERLNVTVPLKTLSIENLHKEMEQHKDIKADIGAMKNDLSQLKQHGVAIIAGSDKDDSSSTALKASLNSLDKRIAALEELADEKAEQLKDAVRDKERHNTELQAYQKRVADEHSWLDQARVDLVSTPEPYDSVDVLKQQQTDLKDLHHNLNQRLTRLPELAVQCDQLCAHESPENARKLRDHLLRLQTGLGDAKMELLGRQARLKQALRESERRQDELAEYNDSVRKLQDWIEETKKLTLSPERVDASALASRREDAKKSLEQGLSEHRRLLETLCEVPVATSNEASDTPNAVGTWSELQGRWESLSNELARKRLLSEDAVTKMIENDSVSGSHRQIWSPTSFQTLTSSTTQIHDVRHLLGELSECWRGLQDQVEDKQSELDDVLSRHQKLQDSLAVTSAWLDDAEMKLVTPSDEMSCQDRLQETENLLDDMKRLRGEIAEMGHVSQDMLSAVSTGSRVLITRSLTDLAGRVQTLEIQATQHEAHIQDTDRQLKEFQQEVHALDTGLKEILGEYNDLDDTLAFSDALDKYLHMEYQLRLYERKLHRLQTQARELTITDPRLSVTLDLASLHKHFTDLQSMVHGKRDDLQKFYVVQEKYGKMLEDYTQFLETSQGKLKTESVTAKDLHHLKQQLSSHKDFFSDLDEHKSLLDSLERQCDHGTIDKLAVEQSHAQNLTAVVRDKASLHAQKLERLVRQWTDVEMKLAKMTRLLTDGENQLPKPVSDADSLDAVREKLAVYRRIARALGDERSSVQEIIERGKNLVKSVSCPALEMTIAEFSNKWLELNKSVNDELKKCETLAEQWHTFDTDAAMLESWLISAKVQISGIKQLSDSDTKSIANIRAKVDRVVEFRKEVESQYPLKNTVFASGQQLLRFKKSDSPRIERKLKEFGDDWDRLVKEVNNTEEFLHQAQMDLMPSRQALSEIVIWVDEVEKTLREDKYSSVAGSPEVELMLKKYKGYKIDIASKQLTVDFVNQAATQLVQEPGDLMRDGTEFAEKLGQLNRRWQSVKSEVNEKHKSLELSYNKWLDYERAIKGLQTWLRDQEDRVKKFHLIGNESNVKTTLRDCKTLQAALSGKERDIESIRKDGMNLVDVAKDSPRCIQMIRDTAEKMKQQWSNLDQQLSHLQGVLEEVLVQWNNYHVEQQTLGHVLSETEYCLGKYAAATMDVNTLNVHVAKLKNLQSEFDKSSGKLDKFSTLSNQLMHVCDSPVKRELVTTLSDVKTKWTNLSSQVAFRITKLEQTIKNWLRYNEEHDREAAWLEARETQLSELETMRDTPGDRQRCLDQCKTLQLDLDNFQSQLVALGRLGDDIVEGFDSPLAGVISSRQKILSQRLATLRHALTKHVHALHDDLTDYKKFETSFDAVAKYLDGVERDLSKKDPEKMADEATIKRRLDELCDLSHQFTRRQQDLDALNDMGYRMALSEAHAGNLLGLNHRWHGLLGDTAERYRAMQGLMLMQQDFHQKREMWMAFLTLAERDLTCDIAGNYKDLCEQQRKCEQFQVEVYNKQQILQSILTDGQRMLRLGDVPDREDFERKLTALSDQWQNVVLKADRFKAVIDDAVVLWQTYFALSDRINTWLANREFDLEAYDVDKTTLQKIKYLLEKSRSSLSDFNSQENNYKKIHTVSRELLQQTDADAERELRANLSTLQQRWYQAFGTFDGHRERLEDVMNQWQQCEDDIEDIVNWLREIRLVLCADVPASYEALQRELHKCKDFEAAFANSEDKRHVLHARQTQLAGLVEAEDLGVLNERVRLLDKQWEELRNQVCERRDAVEGRLDHWQRFTRRFRGLCEWIDETEARLSARSDVTIEDLLTFIEQDYQQMITDKEVEVVELTEEGRRLVRASVDTRANDIHQKLATLEDKWQHLKTLFNNRRSKLQETLATIRQLEMSMSGLRKWLAQREYELAQPLSYADCESKEITNKLDKHQELHRDIERHSAGVTSVLNLCEVLLQDSEACPGPSDYSALDKANRSLDKRWRNICVLATERRNLIEDTWHKWEKLMGDCSDFSKWVREVEAQVRPVRDDHSDVTTMKEEIRYFEALEHKVHDHITYLEDINKQYRLLAREGRTDNSGTLKASMQEANDRWDALLKRITATQLGLKRNTGMLDDFARKREDLMAWLRSTLDQLMDTEFSEDITPALKVASVKKLKRSFESRLPEVDSLDKMAVLLMEQCEPSESSRVESQIDELHRCKREVVDALKLCLMKLHQTLESKKKKTKSSKDKDVPDAGRQVYTDPGRYRHSATEKQRVTAHVTPIPSHRDTAKNTPEKRSGRRGDKSGSKMDVRIEELAQALEDAAEKLLMVETELRCVTPTGPDTEFAPQGYIRLLVDCEESIEYVRQCEERLKSVSSNVPLSAITSQVTSLMNRWEILNARAVEKDTRLLEHRENWSRFQADINTMSIWLSEAHAYRDNDRLDASELGYKDTSLERCREFDVQLDDMRALLMTLNVTSKAFVYNRSPGCRETRARLHDINTQWERLYSGLHTGVHAGRSYRGTDNVTAAGGGLDTAKFHYTIHDSLRWLEGVETAIQHLEPVTTISDEMTARSTHRQLVLLNEDMEHHEPVVTALRETADQLLLTDPSPETSQARDKSRIICNRLRSLKRRCQAYIAHLDNKLYTHPAPRVGARGYGCPTSLDTATVLRSPLLWPRKLLSGLTDLVLRRADSAPLLPNSPTTAHESNETKTQLTSRRRILLTFIPLIILVLLLLLAVWLTPVCDDDCIFANNFKWSLSTMKVYPNGPPPT